MTALIADPPRASHRSGRYVQAQAGDEAYWAFVPRPFPPDPPVVLDARLQLLRDRANAPLDGLMRRVSSSCVSWAAEALRPVYAALRRLEELGVLREVTGRQRGRLDVYDESLATLSEGTESPR